MYVCICKRNGGSLFGHKLYEGGGTSLMLCSVDGGGTSFMLCSVDGGGTSLMLCSVDGVVVPPL